MATTKDEYDASECLGKYKTLYNFYICSNCHPRMSPGGQCDYRMRGRCEEDPDGPSAEEVLTAFLEEGGENENRTSTIRLFCMHFGRCWDCVGCEYWELPSSGGESSITRTAYSTTHGVKTLIGEIIEFCTYFIVRKCGMDQEERKVTVLCMMELVSFLVAKRYLTDGEEAERIISAISPGFTLEPDTIMQKLDELWANDYWRKLLKEKAKRVKKDNSDEPKVGKTFEPQMPWTVEKITSKGWLLSNYDEHAVEVLLPDSVRNLGVEDMEISCMKVVYIGCGIWEPSGAYGNDESVCANIYPP